MLVLLSPSAMIIILLFYSQLPESPRYYVIQGLRCAGISRSVDGGQVKSQRRRKCLRKSD